MYETQVTEARQYNVIEPHVPWRVIWSADDFSKLYDETDSFTEL